MAQSCGYVLYEGKTLTALAAAPTADGEFANAIDLAHSALEIHRACDHRLELTDGWP